MSELRGGPRRTTLDPAESATLAHISALISSSVTSEHPVGMILLESINVKELSGLSQVFIQHVRALCTQYGIYMAVDEVMTGLKTWSPFISLLYSTAHCLPDFISFGKSFLLSGVVAINKSASELKTLRTFIGETTSACDATLVHKSIWIMTRYKQEGLFERIADLDVGFVERFAELEQDSQGKFHAQGVGLLWKLSHPLHHCLMPFLRITPTTHFPLEQVQKLTPMLDAINDPIMTQREVAKDQLQYYSDTKGESIHMENATRV